MGNILEIVKDREGSIQDNLEYFSKQFNPETAQNIWQDALYERIGVFRLAQTYTRFSKEISGTPNSVIEKSSILIRNALDGNVVRHGDVNLRRYALQVAGGRGNPLLERVGDVDNRCGAYGR